MQILPNILGFIFNYPFCTLLETVTQFALQLNNLHSIYVFYISRMTAKTILLLALVSFMSFSTIVADSEICEIEDCNCSGPCDGVGANRLVSYF